jgi:hypothetical protein
MMEQCQVLGVVLLSLRGNKVSVHKMWTHGSRRRQGLMTRLFGVIQKKFPCSGFDFNETTSAGCEFVKFLQQ